MIDELGHRLYAAIMATRRRKYVLYLDAHQIEALRKISQQTKIPASVIAREGIDYIIGKYQK